jgi:hypothetical protein
MEVFQNKYEMLPVTFACKPGRSADNEQWCIFQSRPCGIRTEKALLGDRDNNELLVIKLILIAVGIPAERYFHSCINALPLAARHPPQKICFLSKKLLSLTKINEWTINFVLIF